ncbi:hypothetical protein SARC_00050 [Sphaeroforma arctica JP610]|uniref:Uncharacterized protein n=1 Tax=Sphaeroforma arctica JP610 TaxID=667725 RepID=A0A0L0GFI8_9EUKA|nr:hypothetical protein SARC_00050 [Sphaeroforma arctica JP610]KNC87792.1 hypothetical protein SARC_00050 [Sphaeroforma arctica JP610]|eukprot:XP_014161694.1 hypothetical protein SARC_00050 [Sphaeroforma arctica JP610]
MADLPIPPGTNPHFNALTTYGRRNVVIGMAVVYVGAFVLLTRGGKKEETPVAAAQ